MNPKHGRFSLGFTIFSTFLYREYSYQANKPKTCLIYEIVAPLLSLQVSFMFNLTLTSHKRRPLMQILNQFCQGFKGYFGRTGSFSFRCWVLRCVSDSWKSILPRNLWSLASFFFRRSANRRGHHPYCLCSLVCTDIWKVFQNNLWDN